MRADQLATIRCVSGSNSSLVNPSSRRFRDGGPTQPRKQSLVKAGPLAALVFGDRPRRSPDRYKRPTESRWHRVRLQAAGRFGATWPSCVALWPASGRRHVSIAKCFGTLVRRDCRRYESRSSSARRRRSALNPLSLECGDDTSSVVTAGARQGLLPFEAATTHPGALRPGPAGCSASARKCACR